MSESLGVATPVEATPLLEAPRDAIAAVTHANPYPYYAELAARGGMQRDDKLGLWVAASAADVTAVLTSELCGARPLAEPVPKPLLGSATGDLFGRWIRMQDGPAHRAGKAAFSAALESQLGPALDEVSRRWAEALAVELAVAGSSQAVDEYMYRLPASVLGTLLGLEPAELKGIAEVVGELARGIFPGADPAQIERAKSAAGPLRERMAALLREQNRSASLLSTLAAEAQRAGVTAEGFVEAHGVGVLFQAYDATAGLIGNALLAVARHGPLPAHPAERTAALPGFLREVARHDPSTHNTRRFLQRDGKVAGRDLHQGEAVLVVVAAANHDAAANPDPHRFDPHRAKPRGFTFGLGPHACPAEAVTMTIVEAGVTALLQAGVDPARLASNYRYRPAPNVRIPVFHAG